MDGQLQSALQQCELFAGVRAQDYTEALNMLATVQNTYEDGDILLHLGERTTRLGIVVEQRVRIEFYDELGNASIIAQIGHSGTFAEAIACADAPSIVQATAVGPVRVLWIDCSRLMSGNAMQQSPFVGIVMRNIVEALARKNMILNQKMQLVSQKRLRDRIKLYLALRESELGAETTRIPMTRSELAAYLNVDRSALSRELSRMRDEGLIRINGSSIEALAIDI